MTQRLPDHTVVAVVGLGYIGLPTAAILATEGLRVVGVDVDDALVAAVNRGEVPFVEPDLAVHVAGAVSGGRLSAQTETPPADVYIVAVPTPFGPGHRADLSYVEAAVDALAPHLADGALVVLESTSPPGTTRHVADRILRARPDLSLDGGDLRGTVHVAHCPERVLPGRVMIELVTNDRIVGGLTQAAAERARDLYATFCHGDLHITDATTAELAKLTENAFRDVNIAFANELARVAERVGVDVWELIELANKHPRVNILRPGPGVGGHCIAVDPWFIVAAAPEETTLIRAAREVNDARPDRIADQVVAAAGGGPVAALGLSFKADIDDLRQSPALAVVEAVARRLPGAQVRVVEPHVDHLPAALARLTNVQLCDLEGAVAGAAVVVLLVDHATFRDAAGLVPEGAAVVDTRGLWRR